MTRLSADVRRALLFAAADEAGRRGDRRLGTDHLLMALLHDPQSPVATALGISLARARAAADGLDRQALARVGIRVARAHDTGSAATMRRGLPPLSSGARAVLKGAIEHARPARTGQIDPEDFLLSLLVRRRPDPAAELLHALAVDPDAVRHRLSERAPGARP